MMKELSKTGYSLAVIQAIALRMAFACWLLFMTFPILAQEHSVSLHLNHVSLLEAINAGLIEVYKATLSLARGSESPSRI